MNNSHIRFWQGLLILAVIYLLGSFLFSGFYYDPPEICRWVTAVIAAVNFWKAVKEQAHSWIIISLAVMIAALMGEVFWNVYFGF